MSVSTFGVTWQDVQSMHGKANYTAISSVIEGWITEGGAEVSAIVQEAPGIDAGDVPQDEPLYQHCRSYVRAYAARRVMQHGTQQNPELAIQYADDMARLEKRIRQTPVGSMGDSFDRSEHLGTFRGGRVGRSGGGGAIRGAGGWCRKTRM